MAKKAKQRVRVVVEKHAFSFFSMNDQKNLMSLAEEIKGLLDKVPEQYRNQVCVDQEAWTEWYPDNWAYSYEVYYMKEV